MTHSPTPAERLALRTGNAALLASPDASVDIVATVVFALGSAGLLMDPEKAKRFAELEAAAEAGPLDWAQRLDAKSLDNFLIDLGRATEYEPQCGAADEVAQTIAQWRAHVEAQPPAEDVSPQVQKLRSLLARQREDQYVSELHRDYKTPHDLPEVTS